jgi:Reverse transcriptase (RNA-dependent DNA polymerase)
VVVLRQLGKTATQWRPIALFNIGKIIEVIVAERIADAAEENGLLLTSQIGNRRNRQDRTAWAHGAVATLLQLDIKKAFDEAHT